MPLSLSLSLDTHNRAPYEERARAAKLEYDEQMAKWREEHPEFDEAAVLEQHKEEEAAARAEEEARVRAVSYRKMAASQPVLKSAGERIQEQSSDKSSDPNE